MSDAEAQRVVDRVKDLEHAGYHFEAADGSFELLLRKETGDYEPMFRLESWRVIVEKRADGKVETEATVKIWVNGERYVRTAEGNGPVNALDKALRSAIAEIYPHLADIELVNYKVRILDETKGTGAVTACCSTPPTARRVGLDRRLRERHRGLVGGAGGLARARDAAGARPPGRSVSDEVVPLARPVLGPEEEAGVLEVQRSGQLSLGPRVRAFEEAFAARFKGRLTPARCPAGPRACTWRCGRRRVRRGRGRHLAVLVRRLGERHGLRARAAGVRRHRSRDAEPRPPAAAAAITDRTRALLPVHIFGYPADLPAFEALGLPIVEDACEALGAVHADGTLGGWTRASRGVRVLRQQAAHDGGGGHGDHRGPRARSASTPSATRAARPTWAGWTTTGWASTTGCPTWRARSAWRSWPASTTSSPAGLGSRTVPRGPGRRRGPGAALPGRRRTRRGWFVFVVQVPPAPTGTRSCAACGARRAEQALPAAIHLMTFYRSASATARASSPSARRSPRASLALPFFPEMTEVRSPGVRGAAQRLDVGHRRAAGDVEHRGASRGHGLAGHHPNDS